MLSTVCYGWLVAIISRSAAAISRSCRVFHRLSSQRFSPRLEKAGIVKASEGVKGGYLLARAADNVSFLDIVDAVEGKKPLFDCQEVRGRCAVFGGQAPDWATAGTCAIHAVMLQAEKAMRDTLASQTLASVGESFIRKAPSKFLDDANNWIKDRTSGRARRGGRSPRDVPH